MLFGTTGQFMIDC